MSEFRETLRRLAIEDDRIRRVEAAELLASQLEVRENNLSNRTQVAVWDVQEDARRKIDDLHAHQSDTNLLLATIGAALDGLRADVQTSAAETAARLGKLQKNLAAQGARLKGIGTAVSELQSEIAVSKEDRASLHAKFDDFRAEFEVYRAGSRRKELDAITARIDALERKAAEHAELE